MRVKSGHLQGIISGEIKWRLQEAKKGIIILAERTEAKGDIKYLEKRNAELEAQLRAAKQEEKWLREDMDNMEGRIKELRQEMKILKDRMGSRSMSLEPERLEGNTEEQRKTAESKTKPGEKRKPRGKTDKALLLHEIDDSLGDLIAYDNHLSQHLELIGKIREMGRRRIEEVTESDLDMRTGQAADMLVQE